MTVIAYILMALGARMCLLNWGTLIASWRSKRCVSPVPFVGALPLGYGMSLLSETRAYAWLALIVDYGTLAVILPLPYLAFEARSTSRVNLLHRFTSKAAGRSVTIKLFRRRVAVISVEFDPPVPCEYGACIKSFRRVGTWAATEPASRSKATTRIVNSTSQSSSTSVLRLSRTTRPERNTTMTL